MCGIAVHFRINGPAEALDLQLIRHRGPDSMGEWISTDGRYWLGSTRLAIVDLSECGNQPLTDAKTGNVIVMNGEIYNHRALRGRLGQTVHWQGTSDTETVLKAYSRWGSDILQQLKGMFAFAIYNAERKELFLARDRLGIKPLYYIIDSNGFRAASEVRVLAPAESNKINGRSLSGYLEWGVCPEDNLVYSNIRVLPAGHALIICSDGRTKTWRYWPASKAFGSSPENAVGRLRALIEKSIEEHLLSDVPIASFLSGGIDSSIVTALAAQKLETKLQTFSVGFDVAQFDETAIAQEVAERYGTEHHRIQLSPQEVCEFVTEAVTKLDLPSVDAINSYIVSRAVANRGVKVALSGLGGDELFGGYPIFGEINRLKVLARVPRWLRTVFGRMAGFGDRLTDLPSKSSVGELTHWRRRFFTDKELHAAGLPVTSDKFECPVELPDDFAEVSWAELTGYMRQMLLRDADQMSMAVSLELRVPFLDHELVEYVLGLPEAEKKRFPGPKGLLVEACRDLLPSSVHQRPKAGFVLPMNAWMLGPLGSFVEEGLRETVSRRLLPRKWVDEIQNAFRCGRLHWTRLWSIVVLGHFAKRLQLFRSDEDTPLHSFS